MTTTEQLTGRKLDAAIAREVCGWGDVHFLTYPNIEGASDWYGNPANELEQRLPSFSTDLNACRRAEQEIERRGLVEQYVGTLRSAVWRILKNDGEVARLLIYADAETRCRAMIAALEKP